MEKFARIIVGYHGCGQDFADDILTGRTPIEEWQKSQKAAHAQRTIYHTYEEMKAALDATRVSPEEGWERMVRNGIINREGEVTRLVGGKAEPEPGAMRPADRRALEANGNR